MSRIACTLLLAASLPIMACSKATETAGAAGAADLATPAGLTNMLTSKLGISEAQASQALGAVLGQAKGQLSPEDYAKLSGAIPGADNFLSAAADAGIGAPSVAAVTPPTTDSMAPMPVAGADSIAAGAPEVTAPGATDSVAAAGADAAAAAGESVGMSALNSAFSKIGIPPEAASQFVPVLTDYVGKVGGPDAANIMKGLF